MIEDGTLISVELNEAGNVFEIRKAGWSSPGK
jgi:hypothetical protein